MEWCPSSPPATQRRLSTPQTPDLLCTPTKPKWETCALEACAQSRYPTSYKLMQAVGKGEDRLTVACNRGETLWAVFDGHRGSEVAALAQKNVPQLVWSNLAMGADPREAHSHALAQCHQEARAEIALWKHGCCRAHSG